MTIVCIHNRTLYADSGLVETTNPLKKSIGSKLFVSKRREFAAAYSGTEIISEELLGKLHHIFWIVSSIYCGEFPIEISKLIPDELGDVFGDISKFTSFLLITRAMDLSIYHSKKNDAFFIENITGGTQGFGSSGDMFGLLLNSGVSVNKAFATLHTYDELLEHPLESVSAASLKPIKIG